MMDFKISFFLDYLRKIGNHFPVSKPWGFLTEIVETSLIPQADTYFIDGSSKDIGGTHGPDSHLSINTSFP